MTVETYVRAWGTGLCLNGNNQAALGRLLRITKNLVIDLSWYHKIREVDEGANIEMIESLLEVMREMLVLRYMLGWEVKHVAEHLELSENNASVTIRQTLQRDQCD